jgi:SnoaL-like domain
VAAPTCPATLAEPFDPRMVIGGLRKQGSEDPVLFPIDQAPPLGEVRRCRVGVARQRSLGVIALRAGEAKVVESVPPTQGEWDHMIDRAGPLARDELTPAVPALVAIPSDQPFQCDGPPLTATKPTRHGRSLNPGCDSGLVGPVGTMGLGTIRSEVWPMVEKPMVEKPSMAGAIAERVRAALKSADLTAIAELLDPNVCWGAPDDRAPSCQNRDQVLGWYRRGRPAGVRARVSEMVVHGEKILVGLKVVGNRAAKEQGGEADRWQVLTIHEGHIVDIRGFEERSDAIARAGVPV